MVRVYVEGGGDSNSLKTELRKAFQSFFASAGLDKKPRVVACGSRHKAFKDYCIALRTLNNNDITLLLVDSESLLCGNSPVEHLTNEDQWQFPQNTDKENIHLMAVVMETWLISDADGLAQCFGTRLDRNQIPQNHEDYESIPKEKVYSILDKALQNTNNGKYSKAKHSFKALSCVDAAVVSSKCKHAELFIKRLRMLGPLM